MYNPSLRREARYEPAAVLPVTREQSLIDWLESNNRLIYREIEEGTTSNMSDEDVDIAELMDGDDNLYSDDSSDDMDED
ncbi:MULTISPECIES: DUF3134 domain-containing protein [Synechocystis]|uniref:DUF3134 domain-containing protein n=1 Tax=Synechocystis salina LEGE 00031 TaxID=1828736 RepID=A0ABR9VPZ5_9SYNC|nr:MULTISPECIES: DUF3134 domain-containing protein [Synechocystis]MBD2654043.1 DUF3134 domain-containing protein [Synechocystis sp. FACHB-383]MBE9195620.1 DUF3134 domain-containing protein [Synechocystis sp. LEGE 06083]MBE9204148.1 DUF3134 domain-containing protein [Synechocystis salina LEGE 06099]MBE9240210.1 DUF3134 domain-containing protein [Synechocystis salina LEGE 00041]MBE9253424.1 DUF3134 domain-containing protein [Synechocystis salina LEGE 00031]